MKLLLQRIRGVHGKWDPSLRRQRERQPQPAQHQVRNSLLGTMKSGPAGRRVKATLAPRRQPGTAAAPGMQFFSSLLRRQPLRPTHVGTSKPRSRRHCADCSAWRVLSGASSASTSHHEAGPASLRPWSTSDASCSDVPCPWYCLSSCGPLCRTIWLLCGHRLRALSAHFALGPWMASASMSPTCGQQKTYLCPL